MPQEALNSPAPSTSARQRPSWMIILLLGVLWLGLRLPLPQIRPMWADEAYSVAVAHHSLPDIWHISLEIDAHPPGYYWLLHLWMVAWGDSLHSLRILSDLIVLAGIIVAFFAVRKLLNEQAAWVTSILLVVSPFVCRLDEARDHSLMLLFGALAVLVLAHAYQWRHWYAWLGAAIVCIGALYCSYNAIEIVVGLSLAMLWLFRHQLRQAALGVASFVALVAVASPPLVAGIASAGKWGEYYIHSDPWPHLLQWGIRRAIRTGVSTLVGYHHQVWMELAALVALVAVGWIIVSTARHRTNARRLAGPAPLLAIFVLSGWLFWSGGTILNRTLLMNSAYYAALIPALYALVALALMQTSPQLWRMVVISGLAVAMLGGHGLRYYNAQHQVNWAEIIGFIDQRQQPGDVIAVSPPYVQLQAEYHHRGPAAVTGVPADFDVARHRALSPEMTLTPDKLPKLIAHVRQYQRVWLIETRMDRTDPERTVYNALNATGQQVDLNLTQPPGNLDGMISLFEMPPPPESAK